MDATAIVTSPQELHDLAGWAAAAAEWLTVHQAATLGARVVADAKETRT